MAIKLPIGPGPKRELLRAIRLMRKGLNLGLRALARLEADVRKIRTTKKRR